MCVVNVKVFWSHTGLGQNPHWVTFSNVPLPTFHLQGSSRNCHVPIMWSSLPLSQAQLIGLNWTNLFSPWEIWKREIEKERDQMLWVAKSIPLTLSTAGILGFNRGTTKFKGASVHVREVYRWTEWGTNKRWNKDSEVLRLSLENITVLTHIWFPSLFPARGLLYYPAPNT